MGLAARNTASRMIWKVRVCSSPDATTPGEPRRRRPSERPGTGRPADTAMAARHGDADPDQRLRHRGHRAPARPRHPAHADRRPWRDSQPAAPSVRSGRSSPPAEPPAITRTGAERVLANYWRVNNAANQSRSDALLATIEAGSSYAMDAGAYQMSRVTDPSNSQYAPFTVEHAVYYIPRQPAGMYPRWFAARVTYATLASPQHATGAGYVLFVQDSKDAAWKNVLEPYLLPSAGSAPFIETDSQGYAIQEALASAAGLTASPGADPAAHSPVAGWRVSRAGESRQPRRPARPGLLPGQAASRISRHRPPRHLRPGLRPEDRRRRRTGLLSPHRAAQPDRASRPDHPAQHPRLLLLEPGPHLRGARLCRRVRRLPPRRLCWHHPRRHRRRLRNHRARLTGNPAEPGVQPRWPRI